MIKILLITIFLLRLTHNSYTFSSQFTCLVDGVTKCNSWIQSLSFYQNIGACFPAIQKVVTSQGIKQMDQLQIGDKLLGYHYQKGPLFSPLRSWLHKLEGSKYQYEYHNIKTQSGSIYISGMHNIGTRDQKGDLNFIFAKDINEESELFGTSQNVIKNGLQIKEGVYAPLTQLFNFYIVISQQQKILVLVHCFAHIQNPIFYENIYYYLEKFMIFTGIADQQVNQSGISTFNILLMDLFPNHFLKQPIFYKIEIKDRVLQVDTTNTNDNQKENFQNQLRALNTYFSITRIPIQSV